jgi:Na+/proline symporter
MRVVDYFIFIVYFLLMLGVGVFFYRKNRNIEDYYVGGRFIAGLFEWPLMAMMGTVLYCLRVWLSKRRCLFCSTPSSRQD